MSTECPVPEWAIFFPKFLGIRPLLPPTWYCVPSFTTCLLLFLPEDGCQYTNLLGKLLEQMSRLTDPWMTFLQKSIDRQEGKRGRGRETRRRTGRRRGRNKSSSLAEGLGSFFLTQVGKPRPVGHQGSWLPFPPFLPDVVSGDWPKAWERSPRSLMTSTLCVHSVMQKSLQED